MTLTKIVRKAYIRFIRPRFQEELSWQRMKLPWFVWQYAQLFGVRGITLGQKLFLLRKFLRIDWFVTLAHQPGEIVAVLRHISQRAALPGEVIVEAGCWQGGSSAKFSWMARLLGYRLIIYDSFQGVESVQETQDGRGTDFSGTFASPQSVLIHNLQRYGAVDACEIVPGWFADTLARTPVHAPVRAAFIDCDIAKGTYEVLQGVLPSLAADGVIFSQDFHIPPVVDLLKNPQTWQKLNADFPRMHYEGGTLVSMRFDSGAMAKSPGQ